MPHTQTYTTGLAQSQGHLLERFGSRLFGLSDDYVHCEAGGGRCKFVYSGEKATVRNLGEESQPV